MEIWQTTIIIPHSSDYHGHNYDENRAMIISRNHALLLLFSLLFKWIDDISVVLHVYHCPAFGQGFVECFVEAAVGRLAVISPLAFGIGMMHK